MQRPIAIAVLAAFPSALLLLYLGVHVTEGWQFGIVGLLLLGFVLCGFKRSVIALAMTYAFTIALSAWVFSVNAAAG